MQRADHDGRSRTSHRGGRRGKVIGRGRGVRARTSAATRRAGEAVRRTGASGADEHVAPLSSGRQSHTGTGGRPLESRGRPLEDRRAERTTLLGRGRCRETHGRPLERPGRRGGRARPQRERARVRGVGARATPLRNCDWGGGPPEGRRRARAAGWARRSGRRRDSLLAPKPLALGSNLNECRRRLCRGAQGRERRNPATAEGRVGRAANATGPAEGDGARHGTRHRLGQAGPAQ